MTGINSHKAVHRQAVARSSTNSAQYQRRASAFAASTNAISKRNAAELQRRRTNNVGHPKALPSTTTATGGTGFPAGVSSPVIHRSSPATSDRMFTLIRTTLWIITGIIVVAAALSKQGQALTADLANWSEAIYDEQIRPILEME